ncbi:MAG: hypothetical protein ABI401_12370 [Candidatus Dormibacter sp.]
MDQGSRERGPDRGASPIDPHRDRKGAAEPGRVGSALAKREHADVEWPVREPGDQHGRHGDPCFVGDGEEEDTQSGGQRSQRHDQSLATLGVDSAEGERRRNGRQAIDRPELADEDGVGLQALEGHYRHGHHQDAEAHIHQRDDEGDAAKRPVVNQNMVETGPGLGDHARRPALDDRLAQAGHQGGRDHVHERGGE